MKNKLTVIIPLYNQEKYIKQCLESILKQKFCGLSVIVVNDGSTDSSLSICESIAKKVNNRDIFFVFLLKCSAFFSLLTLTKGDGYEEGMVTFSERFFSGVCIGCRA